MAAAVLRVEDPAKAAVYPVVVLSAAVLRMADPAKAAVYPVVVLSAAVLRMADPAQAAVYPKAVQTVVGPPLRVLRRGRPPVLREQPAAVPVMLPQARPPVKFLLPAIPSKKAPPLQAQRATTLLPTKLRLGTVNPIRFLLKAYHPTRTPVIQKHPVSHTLITTLQIQLLKKQVRLIRINPGEMTPSRQLNQGRVPRKPVLLPINLLQAGVRG